jgi:hypothetical protein
MVMPAIIPMIAMTSSNSTTVKPGELCVFVFDVCNCITRKYYALRLMQNQQQKAQNNTLGLNLKTSFETLFDNKNLF